MLYAPRVHLAHTSLDLDDGQPLRVMAEVRASPGPHLLEWRRYQHDNTIDENESPVALTAAYTVVSATPLLELTAVRHALDSSTYVFLAVKRDDGLAGCTTTRHTAYRVARQRTFRCTYHTTHRAHTQTSRQCDGL